jgi:membrane protein
MSANRFWSWLKEAYVGWTNDRAPTMGAALAYYCAFSLAPLLIIVIAVAGAAFGRAAAQGTVMQQLHVVLGDQGTSAVATMLEAQQAHGGGFWATVLATATLLLGATTVFVELQKDLDQIWKARPRSENGLLASLRSRLLSFLLILGIGFLLLISLLVSTGLATVGKYWSNALPGGTWLLHLLDFGASLAITTALFAMIYKILPNADIAWRDVWTGAAATSLLFTVGRIGVSFYLGRSAIDSAFGAAGAFVILLVWLYYSAQIFLYGAELTRVFAQQNPPSPRPLPRKEGSATARLVHPSTAVRRMPGTSATSPRSDALRASQGWRTLRRITIVSAWLGFFAARRLRRGRTN